MQSKRHLPKDMMLTALARPRFDAEGNCVFDGKICCERVCEPTGPRAKKAFKDVSMNADKYYNMVTTLVFPAIVEKLSTCVCVRSRCSRSVQDAILKRRRMGMRP